MVKRRQSNLRSTSSAGLPDAMRNRQQIVGRRSAYGGTGPVRRFQQARRPAMPRRHAHGSAEADKSMDVWGRKKLHLLVERDGGDGEVYHRTHDLAGVQYETRARSELLLCKRRWRCGACRHVLHEHRDTVGDRQTEREAVHLRSGTESAGHCEQVAKRPVDEAHCGASRTDTSKSAALSAGDRRGCTG